MKKLFLPVVVLFLTAFSFSQEAKKDDWIRVQSDDGEFSIEIPVKYGYFYDKSGFKVGGGNPEYDLKSMNVVNSFIVDTLISFEIYQADRKALNGIMQNDENSATWEKASIEWSRVEKSGLSIKQLIIKDNKHYTVRQYFSSKRNIFILTTSSRLGETQTTKRFLNSLVFKPNPNKLKSDSENRFSSLSPTQIEYGEKVEEKKNEKSLDAGGKNPLVPSATFSTNSSPGELVIVSRPKPIYTDEARMKGEQGVVQIRLQYSEFGQITKVTRVKFLRFGLFRNAVFAALRLKFLPEIADGKPISVSKVLEYRFAIY